MTQPGGPLAVLQRALQSPQAGQPRPRAGERCEMCAVPVGEVHSHVVNLDSRALMCTCRPCTLLFSSDVGASGAFRAVPDRYLSFPSFELSQSQWEDLQVPVGMAFFFHNSRAAKTAAFYPSVAGATESELDLASWQDLVAVNPGLRTMLPDVEAMLVREGPEGFECYLVPIDACYELVGHLRALWRGFQGGKEVHERIDAFFFDVKQRSKPAPTVTDSPAVSA